MSIDQGDLARLSRENEALRREVAALQTEAARFKTTLYSIGDAVISADTDGKVLQMNPVAEALTGWIEAEAKGRPTAEVFKIVNEETRSEVESPVERVLREGAVVGLANHTLLIARDGAERPIADSGAPIRDDKGAVTGVVLVFRDQTEERAAQRALRESEERYRRTIMDLGEGFYSVTLDGKLLNHNREFNRILGFDPEEDLVGVRLPDFWVHSEERVAYLDEFIKHGVIKNYPIAAKKRNGDPIFVEANSRLVKDHRGQPTHIEGTFIDRTDRKKAEDELRIKNQVFEDSIASQSIADKDGLITHVNPAFLRLWGYTSMEEAIGKSVGSFFANQADATPVLEALAAHDAWEGEFLASRADGSTFISRGYATSLRSAAGELIGYQSTNLDVTRERESEQALQESEEKFAKAFRTSPYAITITRAEDGAFVDINNAFTTMAGFTREEALADSSIGMKLWVNEEDRQRVVNDLRAGRAVESHEYQFRTKSGKAITGLFSAQVIELGSGHCILSSINDVTERKRAEEHLARSEQFLNSIIEQNPTSTWISDGKGTLVKMNQACRDLFGVTEAEVVGKYSILADNLVEAQGHMPLVRDVFEKGTVARFTLDYDARDVKHVDVKVGKRRILDVVVSPISDAQGHVTNAIVQHRDVTELRRAEQALKDSESKFRDTVRHLDEGYYSVTLEGTLLDHNIAFDRILGIDIDRDMKGARLPDFWQDPEDRKEYLKEFMAKGFINNYQINAKTIDGKPIFVIANAHLVKDGNGELSRIDGTFIDITLRKQAEDALQRSEENYRNLFENAQVGMYRSTIDGSAFLNVNKKFAEILGFSREELLGTEGRIRWADKDDRDRMMKRLKDQGGILTDFETKVLGKHQEIIDVLASIELNMDEGFLTGTMMDITERKKAGEELTAAHQQLQASNQQLAASNQQLRATEEELTRHRAHLEDIVSERTTELAAINRELEAFAYSVSHDLRAPLRAIEGFSHALMEDYPDRLDAQGKDYLCRVSAEAQRMAQLIDDLLMLSRVTRAEMREEQVNLTSVAQDVLTSLRQGQPERQVDASVADGLMVQGDSRLLRQVLENLLGNAWKFTGARQKAEIELGAIEQDGRGVTFVRDNGVGFDMKYSNKLFAPFQRLHGMKEFPGNGIGLSTVQRIVKRHGGRVWLESEPDKGTTCYFTLHDKEEVEDE